MPKNSKSDESDCYLKTSSCENLQKAQKKLSTLLDCKTQVEGEMEKSLDEMRTIMDRTLRLQGKVAKIKSKQIQCEGRNRMKADLARVQDERKKVERDVGVYEKRIYEKEKKRECNKKDFD